MRAYQMKDSGIEWLGKIPVHWKVNKVKNKYRLKPSNVDKKTHDDEVNIQLCNYVDVYYNDFITNNLQFMEASANEHEIKKFSLVVDDVIITKDSEDPMDIGVPALVKETKDKLVCGYHLTMIQKRKPDVSGAYLFWCLKDPAIASQLYREATGVTRWAISSRNIKNITLAFPTPKEQKVISDYLEQAYSKIDDTIAIKQQQLDTLEAYRKSIIHEAVTKGLDKTVQMKISGNGWATQIPSHWTIKKIKFLLESHDNKRIPLSSEQRGQMISKTYDYYGASGVIDKVENYIFDEPMILLGEDGANLITRSKPLAFIARGHYWVNNHAHILKPRYGDIRYWEYLLEDQDYRLSVTGAAQPKLTLLNLNRTKVICTLNTHEQKNIADYLDKTCKQVDDVKTIIFEQIKKLKEYRKSLIHECVTGKKRVYQGEVA